jgi:23S rRNA pseudouridine1911/1915/1917 synthase
VTSDELPPALAGERLDRVVALLADVTRAEAATLVVQGHVRVDGEVATIGKNRLRAGQTVSVHLAGLPPRALPAPDAAVEFTVRYEDADVIVVDKPAGLVVHPGAGNPVGTLVNGLLARYPELAAVGDPNRPGIVHRLDAGTTGLLVVAKSAVAYDALVADLAARRVERVYLALVWGHPEASAGIVDAPIGRDPRDPMRMAVTVAGKPARTRFEVTERFGEPPTALLTCRLETGRTHQIRVHLEATGHPVVGDSVYGGARSALVVGRPFLHAHRLAFDHPVTGDQVSVESVLPADLATVIERLRSLS